MLSSFFPAGIFCLVYKLYYICRVIYKQEPTINFYDYAFFLPPLPRRRRLLFDVLPIRNPGRKHITITEKFLVMNIEDDLRQLSLRLKQLGLEEVVAERRASNDSFRVVYVNKNTKTQRTAQLPEEDEKKTSSRL